MRQRRPREKKKRPHPHASKRKPPVSYWDTTGGPTVAAGSDVRRAAWKREEEMASRASTVACDRCGDASDVRIVQRFGDSSAAMTKGEIWGNKDASVSTRYHCSTCGTFWNEDS
mmetsp:Transcript_44498/g.87288  ORF Transcript_44498/g.87288 Transcript_44498/m.87288 type:complete len:114 (+) Transcript_44498:216-557(+)